MSIKTKCIICKLEEELNKEEIADINRIIERNPKAKSTDYLRIISIARGPVCTGNKEHKLMFHEDFTKAIDESVSNVKKYQEEFNKLDSRDVELKNKLEIMYKEIRNLAQERADVIENKNTTSDVLLMVKEAFRNVSGTDNVKLWS